MSEFRQSGYVASIWKLKTDDAELSIDVSDGMLEIENREDEQVAHIYLTPRQAGELVELLSLYHS